MKIINKGIVWDNPKPYLETRHGMHPTFVNLGNKEFLCAHDIGNAPEAMDYQTWQSRSLDGGKTWKLEGTVNKEKTAAVTTSMVRISKTATGLVGLGARVYRDHPGEGVLNRENLGHARQDLILLRSQNQGKTWSMPETITPPLVGPSFEVSHKILELTDGVWLAPMATWRGWDGSLPNGQKAVVLRSLDKGQSFPEYSVTFDGDSENVIYWEQSVAEIAAGKLLVTAWVYHPASGKHLPNRYTYSSDNGQTFAPPREIGINGQTCKVCKLNDGRIFMAYRRNDRPGLWAQIAELAADGTLKLGEELLLWGNSLLNSSGMDGTENRSDELSGLKFGYPQPEQLEDNSVFIVFWAFEDWNCKIRYVNVSI